MLALHKVGTRLDMRACNYCGLPQHHQDSAAAESMHTCRSKSSVAVVGTSDHRMHLRHSAAGMSALLAASIGAICSSSVTVCISDRLVCSYTRVGRGRDHDHPHMPSRIDLSGFAHIFPLVHLTARKSGLTWLSLCPIHRQSP